MKTEKDSTLSIDEWNNFFNNKIDEKDNTKYKKVVHSLCGIRKRMMPSVNTNIKEDVIIYAKIIDNAFSAIFNTWEYKFIVNDKYIVMCNDLVCIELTNNKKVECILSFNMKTNPVISAEAASTLKTIFGPSLIINDEMFIINPFDSSYVWGQEEIKKIEKYSKPKKIRPIIFFNEEGNC